MTVDGQESPSVTVVGNATTLDVERKLYLGGLPSHYRARNIGTVSSGLVVWWRTIMLQCSCLSYFA